MDTYCSISFHNLVVIGIRIGQSWPQQDYVTTVLLLTSTLHPDPLDYLASLEGRNEVHATRQPVRADEREGNEAGELEGTAVMDTLRV